MTETRAHDLIRFHRLLANLERKIGVPRRLSNCDGRMSWPSRGVYFFREPGEDRTDTGTGRRIVRVGSHALKTGAGTRLWTRLSQHRGRARSGGGNHRGSIFRLLVGTALIEREGAEFPSWGHGNRASRETRHAEGPLERAVSGVIGAMPFLWLDIGDEPGPNSLRGYMERNAIALLCNWGKKPLEFPSPDWLGRLCNRPLVRESGLWNQRHVTEQYDRTFLDTLERLVDQLGEVE